MVVDDDLILDAGVFVVVVLVVAVGCGWVRKGAEE